MTDEDLRKIGDLIDAKLDKRFRDFEQRFDQKLADLEQRFDEK